MQLSVIRSQWLRSRIRQAKEARDKQLEKMYGDELKPKDIPPLEVKLLESTSDAFELLLKFIYTDRIDLTKYCKTMPLLLKLTIIKTSYSYQC